MLEHTIYDSSESSPMKGTTYLPDSRIAERYGVCPRTIKRWRLNPNVCFPKLDLRINGRAFTSDATLDAFDTLRRQQPTTATATTENERGGR
jgi:hypothetical protein